MSGTTIQRNNALVHGQVQQIGTANKEKTHATQAANDVPIFRGWLEG